ncbi:MAG: HEAT repeat domain-containing protein [Phycisphaeraceae bacterium]|nr:HEAT repeat domain-containing protein [Phycisphaeraceae bacterium]
MSRMRMKATGLAAWALLWMASSAMAQASGAAPAPAAPDQIVLRAAQSRAVQQILVSARSKEAFLRANAIEAAEALPARIGPLVQRGLDDPDPVVRFASLATIGKLKLSGVAPNARQLLQDPNDSVRAAAMFAIAANFGANPAANPMAVDVTPMARLLYSSDPGTRANVAMLMGMMHDRSAVDMLKDAAHMKLPMASPVRATLARLQIGEAVVKLGDMDDLDAIRASVYSQFDEVRILGVQILGRLQDKAWLPAIKNLVSKPPLELQIAAAGAMGQLGDAGGLDVILQAAQNPSELVRAQAAISLGMLHGHPRAMQELVRLMDDPTETVRLAAAAGLLGGGKDGL